MKNVAWASVAVFFLSLTSLVGVHLWAQLASAQGANLVIAAGSSEFWSADVMAVDGSIWRLDQTGWRRDAQSSPVLPSSVAFLATENVCIDVNGNGWVVDNGTWINHGPPPVAVPTQTTSWGRLKKRY